MLKINDNFSHQYVESLAIVFTEQKETWEYFCKYVPMFNEVSCEEDINKVAKKVHHDFKNIIVSSKKDYQKWWSEEKYNVIKTLSDYFKLPIIDTIIAQVCITPLFTRNIKTHTFLLPTNSEKTRFYNIVTHEIIHFYYYAKLEKSNIDIEEKRAWEISELIVEPIIKYLFPDYIYNSESYNFKSKDKSLANQTIKLFIGKKINFNELIRRMIK